MTKRYKIFVSIVAFVFSICATGIGFGLVGGSSISFGLRVVCNMFFMMQTLTTCWVVGALFRREK